MNTIGRELRHNPLYWLLVFVPVVGVANSVKPEAHTALFLLSILAIVPLAALLSRATESVAAKTGDAIGGLLNATLGNLTELVIAITALRAGMLDLVKASLIGAVVTNSLFMLGGAFLLGGLKHHKQEFNPANARTQAGMLLLATIALVVPSAVARVDQLNVTSVMLPLSLGIACILLATYALSLLFSLKTHRDVFAGVGGDGDQHEEKPWPLSFALGALAIATLGIAYVSEIFVESVQQAAVTLGMSKAFVGFIVVALVGAAAEMATAFSAARKNRLDLSVGVAMGSSAQIALFVAPALLILSYFVAPTPMDLNFGGGQVLVVLLTTLTVSFVVAGGRAAWYSGIQLLAVYAIFAVTAYLIPG
ncbi:MAG TPA: calcium/proton exchanger [Thermoanaerobaculia bacterium]|nr:calcium/proton exchanger [Thermoanaerobaculia bacterium]